MVWEEEKEEHWLTSQSKLGWHLVSVVAGFVYIFQKGEPKDLVYRLDHNTKKGYELNEYVSFIEESGWEYICEIFNGWKYFKKEAIQGEVLDLYTDEESRVFKYKSLYGIIFVIFMVNFFQAVLSIIHMVRFRSTHYFIIGALTTLATVILGYALLYLDKKSKAQRF